MFVDINKPTTYMASTKFKVESGIQLLARLTKKPNIERFYPKIFKNGPQFGDFIELYSENSMTCLISDLISEAIIPSELNGADASVVIFNTDGNFSLDYLIMKIKYKLLNRLKSSSLLNTINDFDALLDSVINKLFIFDIYEPAQFYASIQNLENLLLKNSNITFIIFHTLTAFYWSEQTFKVTKMDVYLKKILQLIRQTIKDFKVTVLYSRPQYFSSTKETIENLEPCCKSLSDEQINYRIQIVYNDNGTHNINVRTYNKQFQHKFRITDDNIIWL